MRPRPTTVPIATRIAGVMRLFSKEYFTRNTIPRKRTNPPIQAKSFTPKNASQSNGFAGGDGGTGGRGGTSIGRASGGGIGGGGGSGGIGSIGGATRLTNGGGGGATGSGFFASAIGVAGAAVTPRASS